MTFTTKTYIAIGAAVLLITGILGGSLWSGYKVSKLETAVQAAKQTADQRELHANAKEIEAAQYKQKIDYLERQLDEIRDLANKQDEELHNLTSNTRSARVDVERARRTRAAAVGREELCAKLAQVGHPCD